MKEIQLTRGFVTLVDDEDYEKIKPFKWGISSKDNGRAIAVQARVNGKNTYLHRFIMNPEDDLVVDHIDRNPLNNQRSNLRICTRSENQRNRTRRAETSKYKGVHKRKGTNRFEAYIKLNKKRIHIGCFGSEVEAALAYNEFAIKLHGEFAALNNIDLLK